MIKRISPQARANALKGSAATRDRKQQRAKTEVNWDDAIRGLKQILNEVDEQGRET